MPNYPPASWIRLSRRRPCDEAGGRRLRLVYVGAVSLRDTWIEELLQWLARQNGDAVSLDLYVSTTDTPTLAFLRGYSGPNLRVQFPGISYYDLPSILGNYDIGLILYRGTTDNYIWNAPNKLFEYLVCGLDVWYPREMRGIPEAINCSRESGVLELDFSKLMEIDLPSLCTKFNSRPTRNFTSIDATEPLFRQLLNLTPCDTNITERHEPIGFTGSES